MILVRKIFWWSHQIQNWMLHPAVPNGIVTHLWAGTAPETADYNGKVRESCSLSYHYPQFFRFKYLIPWARVGKPRADTQTPEIGEKLWTWLEEQVSGRWYTLLPPCFLYVVLHLRLLSLILCNIHACCCFLLLQSLSFTYYHWIPSDLARASWTPS